MKALWLFPLILHSDDSLYYNLHVGHSPVSSVKAGFTKEIPMDVC